MKIGTRTITGKDAVWFIICLGIIIAFLSGEVCRNAEGAADVVSGASTVVSIVLSVVAILYTMIEGSNSSAVNKSTIDKLNEIDVRLAQTIEKTEQSKDIEAQIKQVLPELIAQANTIEIAAKNTGAVSTLNPETLPRLQALQKYFLENMEE